MSLSSTPKIELAHKQLDDLCPMAMTSKPNDDAKSFEQRKPDDESKLDEEDVSNLRQQILRQAVSRTTVLFGGH